MRNLKRALSLTLASVMLLGMMVIGSSAAKGYPDVDDNDNVEAIEVLQAVAVMVGDAETGNFRPDAPVSRAEMAVVMGLLLNLDYNYYVSTCPFADVSGNYEWARGWVGACAANGIIAGRSATSYDPGATVTAIEAASMMMRALGYFKNPEDYADGFQVVTVRQGSQIGIFSGIGSDATTPMTRNQVAQLALNALRSNMVDFTGSLGVEVNGVKVNYRAEYTPRTGTESKYNAIAGLTTTLGKDESRYYIQLGEQLYDGKLKLNDDYQDAFGRPARKWEYDGKEIGTYAKYELLREEYTTQVTGKDLYELIGKGTIDDKDYDFYISVDGETEKDVLNSTTSAEKDHYFFDRGSLLRTNTNQVGGTGNGVLTQVFIDTEEKIVYIVVINTYLAEAEADYSEKKDEVSFTLYNLDEYNSTGKLVKDGSNDKTQLKVSGEDFNVKSVESGDKFLATVAEGEIQTLTDVRTIEDATITSFRLNSYLVTEGTQYDYASTARYDTNTLNAYDNNNMKDTKYRVFLDNYGYVIGVEIVEDPDQYVFLTAIDSVTQNRQDATGEGTIIFLDGTSASVKIDLKKSKSVNSGGTGREDMTGHVSALMNTWCTYSVSEDNVYTLIEVGTSNATMNKAGQNHLTAAEQGADGDVKYDADQDGNYTGITMPTAQTSGTVVKTIGKKSISLPGVADSSFKTVYGNDESIYMSAETDLIIAKTVLNTTDNTDEPAIIITGVDGITTGVQDANLNAWNAHRVVYEGDSSWKTANPRMADVSNGVYTLFNDKGYVIAAIVVGEDDSASTEYAWVSGIKMNYESHDSSKWTYARDVIINGKEDVLTEVETDGTTVPDIKANNYYAPSNSANNGSYVWEVKLKADETVKTVNPLTFTGSASSQYINDMKYLDNNTSGKSTIILNQQFSGSNWLIRDDGRTLHVETDVSGYSEGFPVASNANIIVVKDEEIYRDNQTVNEYNYKADISDTFVCGSDGRGLKAAVRTLNDSKQFNGYIVAIFKDGVAESVIIYDQTRTQVDINNGPGGKTLDPANFTIDYTDPDAVDIKWNQDVQDKMDLPENDPEHISDADVANLLADVLEENGGWTVNDVKWGDPNASVWNIIATKTVGNRTTTQVFQWDPTTGAVGISIKLNGSNAMIAAGTTIKDLYDNQWTAAKGSDNIYVVYQADSTAAATTAVAKASTDTATTLAAGCSVDVRTRYLKVSGIAAKATATMALDSGNASVGAAPSVKSGYTTIGATDGYVALNGTTDDASITFTLEFTTTDAGATKFGADFAMSDTEATTTSGVTVTVTAPAAAGNLIANNTAITSTASHTVDVTVKIALPGTLSSLTKDVDITFDANKT